MLIPALFPALPGWCETFPLPPAPDSVVGEVRRVQARSDETLVDIAREFDLGYDQIVKANPSVNRWLPDEGAEITLPQLYILPGTTRRGLVLNIAELRLYYFPPQKRGVPQEVLTFPVSIGRMDWRTPLGVTKVVAKERNPAWRPPKSIRDEHARDGDPLPEVIPGGSPENPLGNFALRLGLPTYLIHGVDERKSFGIGMRVTHGCVRMYPEDISRLFELVSVSTPVLIIDQPIKIGRRDGQVLLSVHEPLDEGEDESLPPLPRVTTERVIQLARSELGPEFPLPLSLIASITEEGSGVPQEIGRTASPVRTQQVIGAPSITPPASRAPERPVQAASDDDTFSEESYYRGLARHFDTQPPFLPKSPVAASRRTSAPVTGPEEDKVVRHYVEDRY